LAVGGSDVAGAVAQSSSSSGAFNPGGPAKLGGIGEHGLNATAHNFSTPNWAGYAVPGTPGQFTSVSSTFTVPVVACGGVSISDISTWVGIDGLGTSTVEQDGTDSMCVNDSPVYQAWYEVYPSMSVDMPSVKVNGGDKIVATTTWAGGQRYNFSVVDQTSGTQGTASAQISGAENATVECILEDPSFANGSQMPTSSFSPGVFSGCTANGQPIGNYSPLALDMVNADGTLVATASVLVGGNSFNVSMPGGGVAPGTVVGLASNPAGTGYWLVTAEGAVSADGGVKSYGDLRTVALNAPIAHIISTTDGKGYWMVAGDGGVFSFGDAAFYGSMGAAHLNAPVVSLAPTNDGRGYWMVASDGGVFSFGDARFQGSMGGAVLNQPVVGIAGDSTTGGYWEVASDGGVFSFGAPFYGSTGNLVLNRPIEAMTVAPTGNGYRFVASDGGVFSFGAPFYGSLGGQALSAPVTGMAEDPATGGYWMVGADGVVYCFNAPYFGGKS
jgi:hypothetical protein